MVAVADLIFNLISMRLLTAGLGESANMNDTCFEVMADTLGSNTQVGDPSNILPSLADSL